MNRKTFLFCAAALAVGAVSTGPARAGVDDGWVLVANSAIKGVDAEMLKRIYTGRVVELDGLPLRPVNLAPGSALRRRFLAGALQLDDDDYIAYWTVRRYIGKGAPPRELRNAAEVMDYVQRTPGAIGYIEPADIKPGLVVLMRR